jgi:P27 family predicted phage terminase small subunit
MRGRKPVLQGDANAFAEPLNPPSWLSKDAKAEWRRIMPDLTKRRILTTADLGSLENYCIAIATVRVTERALQAEGLTYATDKGVIKRHPATAIQAESMTRARLLAAELGLTPVSRSRPSIRDDNDDENSSDLGV